MFGIFVFPAKVDDKSYPYKKDPKMVLKLSDEELLHFVKITPKMTYFCHYSSNEDKLPIEEKLKVIEKYLDRDYSDLKKVRGIEDAYQTGDGEKYIKIIIKDKDWFSRYFV